MEFLLLAGFLFILSIGFVVAAGIQIKDYADAKKHDMTLEFVRSVQAEIELASVVKEGYVRTFELPEKIYGTINYSIGAGNSTLVVSTEQDTFTAIIPTLVGQPRKGRNTITNNSTVTITNG